MWNRLEKLAASTCLAHPMYVITILKWRTPVTTDLSLSKTLHRLKKKREKDKNSHMAIAEIDKLLLPIMDQIH